MLSVDILLIVVLFLATYPYVFYPILLYLLTLKRADPRPPSNESLPELTVVVAAHNEASVIAGRIENLQSSLYPSSHLKVLVASDGSTDDTVAVARAALKKGARAEVHDYKRRRGKAAVVRQLVEQADTEIVVSTDANTYFEPDAVRRLARWFGDPEVGCVVGRVNFHPGEGAGHTEQKYWEFETWLKKRENRLGAVLGANGPIYAFRCSAYEPLNADTITDDFVLPMLIRKRGYRIVFDDKAVAREETAPRVQDEFRRRVRIGTGNMQALWLTRSLLSPRAGWTAFTYWSHKVARWAAPLLLLVAFSLVVTQVGRPVHSMLAILGGGVISAALAGWALEQRGYRPPRLLEVAYTFVGMNVALLLGVVKFATGHRDGRWTPTPRRRQSSSE